MYHRQGAVFSTGVIPVPAFTPVCSHYYFLTPRSVAEVLVWHWAVERLAGERAPCFLANLSVKKGDIRFFDSLVLLVI